MRHRTQRMHRPLNQMHLMGRRVRALSEPKEPGHMRRVVVLFVAFAVFGVAGQTTAQTTSIAPADLAATWQLVTLERRVSSGKPERNQQPRGLLILDSAGNVFEWVGTNARQEPDAPAVDPVKALADYSGFWGRYRVDTAQKRVVF